MRRKLPLILFASMVCVFLFTVPAMAECGVQKGATPIFQGIATADNDITIYNDEIAVSFAVDSNNYWNMTRGSILDIGIRGAGGSSYGYDLVNDVEFLNDLWTATGTYDGDDLLTDVDVAYAVSTDKKTVTVTVKSRFWVADADKNGVNDDTQYGALQKPLNVTTVYTLMDGANYVTMRTTVENPAANKVTYKTMYSGYSVSTLAANMYGPFGFYPDVKTTGIAIGAAKDVQEAFGEFVTTYGPEYAVTVQLDDADAYKGSSGYKDVYKLLDMAPGATNTYVGELLVSDKAETASVMARYIDRENITDASTLSGKVTDAAGKGVAGAYVIVEKTGVYQQTEKSAGYTAGFVAGNVVANVQPFVWAITDANGNYSVQLPNTGYQDGTANVKGNSDYTYQLKVEAAGYTSVTTETIDLKSNTTKDVKLDSGATVTLKAVDENGKAIPFKVTISGLTSEMKTLGGSVYFSDATAKDPYTIAFDMSKAKNVTFTATYGAGFNSLPVTYTTDVTDAGVTHTFTIKTVINPLAEGWYTMDNHNHSDFGDGSTTIQDLYSIQIAERLDFNLVSDHDARVNNQTMADLAAADKRVFISSDEISPGWGHWGLLNLPYGSSADMKATPIDATTATPQSIIAKAHELGAIVVMNHPYTDYGFLNNQASVSGGTAAGWDKFDLIELQSTMDLSELPDVTAADWKKINIANLKQTMPAAVTNMDAKTLVSAFALWNSGKTIYLSGGSDAHDAHSTTLYSGLVRVYADMDNYSLKDYMSALTSGHSYITTGPILFPAEDSAFGSTRNVKFGDSTTIKLDAQAVYGMDTVYLYKNGVCVDKKALNGATSRTSVSFTVRPDATADHTWYSIVASDSKGNWAASNPIWVNVSGGFKDVASSAWYFDYVLQMTNKGLMNGVSATKFEPSTNLNRGMAVTVLYRMSGETGDAAAAAKTFSDVDAKDWYAQAIGWASANGIVTGYENGKFGPKDEITREQMAAMLYRYAQYGKQDVSAASALTAFTDANKISGYANNAMKWIVGKGIVNGRTDTTLVPQGKTTRAEFAAMIVRYLG